MEISTAVQSLGALAQETRLQAFRLLVQQGPKGLAAGDIARALTIPHNTLSSHLAILVNAGLISSRRESRSIIYSVNFKGARKLLGFLMQECCQGDEKVCTPVLDTLFEGCCNTTKKPGVTL